MGTKGCFCSFCTHKKKTITSYDRIIKVIVFVGLFYLFSVQCRIYERIAFVGEFEGEERGIFFE